MRVDKLLLLLCVFLVGCASPIHGLYPPAADSHNKHIYIVSHGWHTGIVIALKDIPADMLAEKSDFPAATFLEIGWGDKGFYQANDITFSLAARALFWPSDSVMHVVGFSQSPEKEFPYSEIIEITLSDAGFVEMVEEINATFDREEGAKASIQRRGLYGDSAFYAAKGEYHLFHTCNDWTAGALRKSGFPITTLYASTAGNIIDQTHKRGKVIRLHPVRPIRP